MPSVLGWTDGWWNETSERFILREIWSEVFWLSDSFSTICSQLNRALLRAPTHRSFSISPHLFLFFNHSINLETCLYWLYSWFNAASPRSASIKVHPLYLLCLVSVEAYGMSRAAAGQTGAEFHLSFIRSLPTFRHSDSALPQKRAWSHQPTKVSKKSGVTWKLFFSLVTKIEIKKKCVGGCYFSLWTSGCHFLMDRLEGDGGTGLPGHLFS